LGTGVCVRLSCAAAAWGWRRRAHSLYASRLATAKRHTIFCQRCRRCHVCSQCGLRGGLCADWGRACVRACRVWRRCGAGGVVLTDCTPLASPPLSVTLSLASVAAVAAGARSVFCGLICPGRLKRHCVRHSWVRCELCQVMKFGGFVVRSSPVLSVKQRECIRSMYYYMYLVGVSWHATFF
jgi:hypothetical protein